MVIIMKNKSFLVKLLIFAVCAAVSTAVFYAPPSSDVSASDSELRGVWVSTVANIDYPAKQTTNSEKLRDELDEILDNCKDMGFNAIFFQVRPCSDSFYFSDIFPWSRYLTGTQGVAPDAGFDPLDYITDGAHKRGMQLHAWINPYRITNTPDDNSKLAANNPAVLNPDLVMYDSDGKMYYNPGDSKSIELIVSGAEEIAERYNVDGIHLDDYFYPSSGYDDSTAYSFHKDEYASIEDWRRANVNKLIKTLDERLHTIRPEIQFGVSPRGIWANKSDMAEGSDTRGGGSYNTIYADSRAWVKNGWVDYIMPQIYWYIGYDIADYNVLCDWWSDVVDGTDTKLYIGEGAYRTTSSDLPVWQGESGTNELRTHIINGRNADNIGGFCCFTYSDFINNPSIYALMQELNANGAEAPKGTVSASSQAVIPEESLSVTDNKGEDPKYKNKFTDMNNYWWAMDAVNELAAKGVIKGRSETEFDPDSNITRADNTVLLLRILHKTAGFTDNFDDVYPGKYYYNEIGMAKALGIASGVGNNCFDPDAPIRRQDMATLAYRVLAKEGVLTTIPNTTVLNKFTDADDIYFYAREAMAACVDKGLISGYGDNTIKPNDYASRVEVALFIYRIGQIIG